MSWVNELSYSIIGVSVSLILFWQVLDWKYKRQLKKLKEEYKPEDDTSRYKDGIRPVKTGFASSLQREPTVKANIGNTEFERRELLQSEVTGCPGENSTELGSIESKPKRRWFGWFRRKKVNPEELL